MTITTKEGRAQAKAKEEVVTLRIEGDIKPQGGGGAIYVPVDFLRKLGWAPGDRVVITLEKENSIRLSKPKS